MKKVLAGIVITAFAGLFMVSLLAVFSGSRMSHQVLLHQDHLNYPYFMAY
jgi:hypothetical protein